MQDAMYSALFGALTNEFRLNYIANNLANVNTTGYKRDVLGFQDTFQHFAHEIVMEPIASVRSEKMFPDPHNMSRVRISTSKTDFTQGNMKFTGNPLDVSIAGDGFFKVNTGDGEFYTRSGHFVSDSNGTLMTPQGWPVMSSGGAEINIPAGTRSVSITTDGNVYADANQVGQISIVSISDPTALERKGQNLYQIRKGSGASEQAPENASVEQGYLETANVEVVYEMVNMIEAQRQYEAYQKVMQTSESLDKDAINKVGKGRV